MQINVRWKALGIFLQGGGKKGQGGGMREGGRERVTDTEEPTATIPLSIFPNPARGLVKIGSTAQVAFKELSIFDATGHLVRSISDFKNSEADLSGLPAGIYQLQAQDGDGKRYVGRVVKL